MKLDCAAVASSEAYCKRRSEVPGFVFEPRCIKTADISKKKKNKKVKLSL
jgi:hypothetical protein